MQVSGSARDGEVDVVTRALLGMLATESFNAMTKEARATAPSMSRLLIWVTSIWGRHISRGCERAECEGQLSPRAQVELDRLRDSALHLAATDSGPFEALVECGTTAGRRHRVTVEPDTPPTCECSHLVVTGLPCSHILAGAKCLSALPRRPSVAATSLCHTAHTSVSLQRVYNSVGSVGIPDDAALVGDDLQAPMWVELARIALDKQRSEEAKVSQGVGAARWWTP